MTIDGLDGNNNYYVRLVSIINPGRFSTESSPSNQGLADMANFEGKFKVSHT